jgi:Mrp family chromosome partitioning ATPase
LLESAETLDVVVRTAADCRGTAVGDPTARQNHAMSIVATVNVGAAKDASQERRVALKDLVRVLGLMRESVYSMS